MAEREELRLITSEAELCEGMLVEAQGCAACSCNHRFVLLSRREDAVHCDNNPSQVEAGWYVALPPGCLVYQDGSPPETVALSAAIAIRRLYEVISRRDDEAEQERKRIQDEKQARFKAALVRMGYVRP